ncbi:MAG: hypothetical protein ACK5JM_07405 [Rhodoblastus sp.]
MAYMSVVDHFGKATDAGFTRRWDADVARRQFNVSLALMAALAFCLGLVAYTMRGAPKHPVMAAIEHVDANSPIFGSLTKP